MQLFQALLLLLVFVTMSWASVQSAKQSTPKKDWFMWVSVENGIFLSRHSLIFFVQYYIASFSQKRDPFVYFSGLVYYLFIYCFAVWYWCWWCFHTLYYYFGSSLSLLLRCSTTIRGVRDSENGRRVHSLRTN